MPDKWGAPRTGGNLWHENRRSDAAGWNRTRRSLAADTAREPRHACCRSDHSWTHKEIQYQERVWSVFHRIRPGDAILEYRATSTWRHYPFKGNPDVHPLRDTIGNFNHIETLH